VLIPATAKVQIFSRRQQAASVVPLRLHWSCLQHGARPDFKQKHLGRPFAGMSGHLGRRP